MDNSEKTYEMMDEIWDSFNDDEKYFITFRAIQKLKNIYENKIKDEKSKAEFIDNGYMYFLSEVVRLLPYVEGELRSRLF